MQKIPCNLQNTPKTSKLQLTRQLQKQQIFLYMNNEHMEIEVKIPFKTTKRK